MFVCLFVFFLLLQSFFFKLQRHYTKCYDLERCTIAVYMDVKKNVPKPDEVLLLKKYIAWHFDQHAKKDPETMCVVLLDMTGASVGNLVSYFWQISTNNRKNGIVNKYLCK